MPWRARDRQGRLPSSLAGSRQAPCKPQSQNGVRSRCTQSQCGQVLRIHGRNGFGAKGFGRIAMHHAAIVGVFESLGDLLSDGNRFLERDGAGRDAICQRGTFDPREHERPRAVALFESKDGADVGMVERG
jgi:hypothetical protein